MKSSSGQEIIIWWSLTHACRPRESGRFVVNVFWNDIPVPGSPFNVAIFDTAEELSRHEEEKTLRRIGCRPRQV